MFCDLDYLLYIAEIVGQTRTCFAHDKLFSSFNFLFEHLDLYDMALHGRYPVLVDINWILFRNYRIVMSLCALAHFKYGIPLSVLQNLHQCIRTKKSYSV